MITRRVTASAAAVLEAAREPIPTGFADPVEPRVVDGTVTWSSVPDVVDHIERVAEIRSDGDATELRLRARVRSGVPYFSWALMPFARRSARISLSHIADVIAARATGAAPPPPPSRPRWAPADRMDPERARAIATLFMVLAVASYASSLFSQTIDFVAHTYDASDADLGVTLALTRIGVLVGLVGSMMADRRGRRVIVLAALAGLSVTSMASAVAPNLWVFGTLQVLSRGFVQLASVVAYIAVTEEAPEGARAYLLALGGMAAGTGFALGSLLLPVAEIGEDAWRLLFAFAAAGLLLLPGIARRLPETRRYAALAARAAYGRAREMVDRVYGRRFAAVAVTVFLLSFFAIPTFQFTNRYLQDERGFGAADILLLRAVTQSVTALYGAWLGGRLAESVGRKVVASRATLVLAAATAGFFTLAGPPMWGMMLLATVAGAIGGPSTAAFSTELFPTEIRGRAGAWLLVSGVTGAAVGLLFTGYLAEPLGSVGLALAVTCAAPVLVALLLIPRLPEGRGRALDELSPPEI